MPKYHETAWKPKDAILPSVHINKVRSSFIFLNRWTDTGHNSERVFVQKMVQPAHIDSTPIYFTKLPDPVLPALHVNGALLALRWTAPSVILSLESVLTMSFRAASYPLFGNRSRDGTIGKSHITILVAQNITIYDIITILACCL